MQRLQVARHPNRPTFLDIALNISDKFVELHGDRAGLDDPAMVCGLASMEGTSFMFIGHQKGRNTKVRPFWAVLSLIKHANDVYGGHLLHVHRPPEGP